MTDLKNKIFEICEKSILTGTHGYSGIPPKGVDDILQAVYEDLRRPRITSCKDGLVIDRYVDPDSWAEEQGIIDNE